MKIIQIIPDGVKALLKNEKVIINDIFLRYLKSNSYTKDFIDFLKKKGATFQHTNPDSNIFLITGMLRGAGKTYTALEFLNDYCPSTNTKIVYATRTIGEDEVGTFYDTLKTMSKIGFARHSIKMHAGKRKVCPWLTQKLKNLGVGKEEENWFVNLICERCSRSKKDLPDALKKELVKTRILKPKKNEGDLQDVNGAWDLAEKYDVCPSKIINKHGANIEFLSYAMLSQYDEPIKDVDVVVHDEARHLHDAFTVDNEIITKKKGFDIDDKDIDDYLNFKFTGKKNQPHWFKKVEPFIQMYGNFIRSKFKALMVSKEDWEEYKQWWKKLPKPAWLKDKPLPLIEGSKFVEEESRNKAVYVGQTYGWEDPTRSCGGTQFYPQFIDFADDYLKDIQQKSVNKVFYELLDNLKNLPKKEQKEAKRVLRMLDILRSIVECEFIDLEIINNPSEGEKSLVVKGWDKPKWGDAKLVIFIEGTPYPKEFYKWWLGVEESKINKVTLPSKVEVKIVYEDSQKLTGDLFYLYSKGERRKRVKRSLSTHKDLINKIIQKFEKEKKEVKIYARNTAVKKSGQLGKVDGVIGDKTTEGFQVNADVLIIEGTQIPNISSDDTRKFELARILGCSDPDEALKYYHIINTGQTMTQTMFRAIDRNGERLNGAVLLGDRLPWESKKKEGKCWVDEFKNFFSYLNDNNVKTHKLQWHLSNKNKANECFEFITTKQVDWSKRYTMNERGRTEKIVKYLKRRKSGWSTGKTLLSAVGGRRNNTLALIKKLIDDKVLSTCKEKIRSIDKPVTIYRINEDNAEKLCELLGLNC